MNSILIVEDELLEQEFLKSIILDEISKEDIIITCESGFEAIKLAKKHRPNIIVMDILIPEIDGLCVIEEIRKFLPTTSIIVSSACSDFHYAQKAISLKVFEYLLKPIKPSIFRDVFLKALASNNILKSEEITPSKNEIPKTTRQHFIEESLKYIKQHFKEKLTLEAVSSRAFVNPKYFSHVFKKEMGVSFSEYVIALRVKHACHLLEETDFPAYRISIECGFSDASYFNRVFCSQMNMTPQTYRKLANTSKLTV